MINLLPPEKKQSFAYARRNTRLIGWLVAASLSLVAVIATVIFGVFYINQSIDANTKQVAATREQLKVQKLEDTQKRVQELSSNLRLVVQVLGKEVLFSKLLQQIGSSMPPNTVLTSFSLNQLQGGIDLQAGATDYQTGTQVQVNLADPNNKIFSNADLVNIQCAPPTSATSTTSTSTTQTPPSKYPCTVTIRAQFADNNSFSFIQKGAKP